METPEVKAQRLLEEMAKVRRGEQDPIPPGFLTIEHYAKLWKLKRSQARLMILKLEKANKVKRLVLRRFVNSKNCRLFYFG